METKRQIQIGNMIQRELADIMLKKFGGLVPHRLLTVTSVRMTSDLGLAKVYLSIFPSEEAGAIVAELNKHIARIRYELGNVIRNDMRRIPELMFYLDDGLDYVERIERALKS